MEKVGGGNNHTQQQQQQQQQQKRGEGVGRKAVGRTGRSCMGV